MQSSHHSGRTLLLSLSPLALAFSLPPGAYATGLLAELGEVRDASRGGTCAPEPAE